MSSSTNYGLPPSPQVYALPAGATTQSQAALITTQNANNKLATLINSSGGSRRRLRRRRKHIHSYKCKCGKLSRKGIKKSRKNLSRKRRYYMRGGAINIPTMTTTYNSVSPQSVQAANVAISNSAVTGYSQREYDSLAPTAKLYTPQAGGRRHKIIKY